MKYKKVKRHFKVRTKIKQRKISKIKKIATTLLYFFILTGIFSFLSKKVYDFLFLSDSFRIKKIEVKGLKSISEKDFLRYSRIKLKDNLLSTLFMDLEYNIKSNLVEIKKIKVIRKFPDTIEFLVSEREPIAWMFDRNKEKFAIDDENVVFELKYSTNILPQIEIEEIDLRKDALVLLKNIKSKKTDLYFDILKLYNIKDRIVLLLKSNTKIFWGKYSNDSFDKKLFYLSKVMEDAKKKFGEVEYIDLKLYSEARVIVKPY